MSVLPVDDIGFEDRLTGGLLTRRLIAWVLDACLISVIGVVIWMGMAALTVLTLGLGAPMFALLAFLPAIYGWLSLLSPLQASPGQALMGLAVARDADLGQPTPLQAFIYIVGYLATLALGVIWAAVAVVTTRHRTLHDMLSGLVVVRRRSLHEALTAGGMNWNNGPASAQAYGAWQGGGRPTA